MFCITFVAFQQLVRRHEGGSGGYVYRAHHGRDSRFDRRSQSVQSYAWRGGQGIQLNCVACQ